MTSPQSTTTIAQSFGHNVLNTARYCLGNRWMLLLLAGVAVSLGLYFGGWGWLVAAGSAPIILSTLPCLIMCGLGVCMMCRSRKHDSAASLGAADVATSASELEIAVPVANSNCCHENVRGSPANALVVGAMQHNDMGSMTHVSDDAMKK